MQIHHEIAMEAKFEWTYREKTTLLELGASKVSAWQKLLD